MKKLIRKILFSLNILVAIATLLAYLAPYISPANFWPLAFFGLTAPYFLFLNTAFLLFWLIFRKWHFLLSTIILLVGLGVTPAYFQLSGEKAPKESKTIKVLSFNVRLFDLYMWTKEKTTRNNIFTFLKEEDPDVLCIQEFYNSDDNKKYDFKTLDTLVQFLNTKFYHLHYTLTLRKTDHWGIITFSKFPIVNKGVVNFANKSDNVCIFTDINVDGKIVRFYNAHLASFRLDKHDYKIMQEVIESELSDNLREEINMLSKLKIGFQIRALQADSIQKSINNSPYPIVFCGDFNDTPSSYVYHTIKGKSEDAFIKSGSGLGQTYIGDFPSFRIDYILYDPSFNSFDYTTHPEKLSDHHPISIQLEIAPKQSKNESEL